MLVAAAHRRHERSLPAALWLRCDDYGSDATAHSAWLGLDGSRWSHSAHGIPVFVLRVKVGAGGDEKLDHTRVE